jgi:hypothetical protein
LNSIFIKNKLEIFYIYTLNLNKFKI